MNFYYLGFVVILSLFIIALYYRQSILYSQINLKNNAVYNKIAKIDNLMFLASIVLVIMFSILCGTRDIKVYDTIPYINYFNKIHNVPFNIVDREYRIGFEYLTKLIIVFVGDNYRAYFTIIAMINCFIVLYSVYDLKDIFPYSFIIYIFFIGFYYDYIVIRQSLAISFVILAYSKYLRKKNSWIIYLLISLLFHESSLIVIAIMVLSRLFKKKKGMYMLWAIALLLYLTKSADIIIEPVFSSIYNILPGIFRKYILYFKDVDYNHKISLYYLLYFAISFVLLKLTNEKNTPKTIINLEVLNIIGLVLLGLFSSITAIIRMCDYLIGTTYIFLIPFFIKQFKDDYKLIIIIILNMLAMILNLRIILNSIK